MKSNQIYQKALSLKKKYQTSNPIELLSFVGAIVLMKPYDKLKGYTFYSNRSVFVVVNDYLCENEKNIVLAHELAHVVLHKNEMKIAPMIDNNIYSMTNQLEYEANLFASEILVNDCDIIKLSNDDMDYFKMCSYLNIPPELLSFKLFSMIKRGYNYNIPVEINSNFLK